MEHDDRFPYFSCLFLALVRGRENVELRTAGGQGALVDIHSAQVNINATRPPATKKTKLPLIVVQVYVPSNR
jgi:hypothetical protein